MPSHESKRGRGILGTDTQRTDTQQRRRGKTEAEIGGLLPRARGCLESPEAGGRRNTNSLSVFGGSVALLAP